MHNDSSAFNQTLVNGIATFSGLTIGHAGSPYVLRFYTDAAITPNYIDSGGFTVSIGPAASVQFTQQPSGARGGQAFTIQPQVKVVDAGGNLLVGEDHSSVTIAIEVNPSSGSLDVDPASSNPNATLTKTLVGGVANFTGLRIDKTGRGCEFVWC